MKGPFYEQEQARKVKARFRLLQHAREISHNVSQTCRFFGISRAQLGIVRMVLTVILLRGRARSYPKIGESAQPAADNVEAVRKDWCSEGRSARCAHEGNQQRMQGQQ